VNAGAWSAIAAAVTTIGVILVGKFTGRSTERAAEVTDEGKFRQQLMERVSSLEARVSTVEAQSDARLAFINVLENHIWLGKQPPPPQRPPGI